MAEIQTFEVQKQVERLNPNPDKPPKKIRNRNSNDPLTKEEVELLLSKIDNLFDYTLLLFGLNSGVRVGEVGFDYNAINEKEGYVNIWDEKIDRSPIYIPEPVFATLNRYWKERGTREAPNSLI